MPFAETKWVGIAIAINLYKPLILCSLGLEMLSVKQPNFKFMNCQRCFEEEKK